MQQPPETSSCPRQATIKSLSHDQVQPCNSLPTARDRKPPCFSTKPGAAMSPKGTCLGGALAKQEGAIKQKQERSLFHSTKVMGAALAFLRISPSPTAIPRKLQHDQWPPRSTPAASQGHPVFACPCAKNASIPFQLRCSSPPASWHANGHGRDLIWCIAHPHATNSEA